MKPINTLQQLKALITSELSFNAKFDFYLKLLIPFCILTIFAILIWIFSPSIAWGDEFPFQSNKRIYLILFLFLIWLLKIITFDLSEPFALQYKDKIIRKKILELQKHVTMTFRQLKTTFIPYQTKTKRLYDLPWYLFIGPSQSGKTTLLKQSNLHFISSQTSDHPSHHAEAFACLSEQSKWWVMQDANIISIPGRWLTKSLPHLDQHSLIYTNLWNHLLTLLAKERKSRAIDGIIVAIPLPEIIKQNNRKKYDALLQTLFQQLHEINTHFSNSYPCQIIITKCDLLPGFVEFFSESNQEELNQTWGTPLSDIEPDEKNSRKIADIFEKRFNQLIKKLNQQLLWRMHHERNPLAKPYIKGFPLQIEHLKEFLLDFIKKFSTANLQNNLQGIYLTSAHQEHKEVDHEPIHHSLHTEGHAVQIFQAPSSESRTYFIKQLLLQTTKTLSVESTTFSHFNTWKKCVTYGIATLLITISVIFLGHDFNKSVENTKRIQLYFSEYQTTIRELHVGEKRLEQTLLLLNSLQPTIQKNFKLDLKTIFSFYSNKTSQQSIVIYNEALQNLLLFEIENYLSEYLKNPVNYPLENVYAALKSYLMLGDAEHFNQDYVMMTLRNLAPKSMSYQDFNQLLVHLHRAFVSFKPIALNDDLTQKTRQYLKAVPTLQLSYAILKNIRNNNDHSEINLDEKHPFAFANQQSFDTITMMFTGARFPLIMTNDVTAATLEALQGNWVIGKVDKPNISPTNLSTLEDQLRLNYINHYIHTWENLLTSMRLSQADNLRQVDALISMLIRPNSPFLQLLQIFYDNTYFEPIISYSPKLQNLSTLLDTKSTPSILYQIFTQLQSLHQELELVLSATNVEKAAFSIVANRRAQTKVPDTITKLRLIARKSPDPINHWLDHIADHSWQYLMQEANRYLDTSWQKQTKPIIQATLRDGALKHKQMIAGE